MKYLKPFLEHVHVDKEYDHIFIQYLISKEKELGMYFQTFSLKSNPDGYFIIAKTQSDPRGNKPRVDEMSFPFEDFLKFYSSIKWYKDENNAIIHSRNHLIQII